METGATVEAMSKLGVDVDNMTTHEDIIKSTADRVLERDIPWEGYQRANLILEKELELIKKYDKKSDDYRNGLITKVLIFNYCIFSFAISRTVQFMLNFFWNC
jgi:hypothetical protein